MNPKIDLLNVKAGLTLKDNAQPIKEKDLLDVLGNELPGINPILEKVTNPTNVYKAVQCFADFTKRLVTEGNLKEVKHCFNVAEKLLVGGNNTVKNAIENVYLFSVSTMLDMTSPLSSAVKDLLKGSLRKEYDRQVCASGI